MDEPPPGDIPRKLIEIRGLKGWAQPFVWIGMNPIALYLLAHVISFQELEGTAAGGNVAKFLNEQTVKGLGTFVVSADQHPCSAWGWPVSSTSARSSFARERLHRFLEILPGSNPIAPASGPVPERPGRRWMPSRDLTYSGSPAAAMVGALERWTSLPLLVAIRQQLSHVDGLDFRFYDLIFPLFVFHGGGFDVRISVPRSGLAGKAATVRKRS